MKNLDNLKNNNLSKYNLIKDTVEFSIVSISLAVSFFIIKKAKKIDFGLLKIITLKSNS